MSIRNWMVPIMNRLSSYSSPTSITNQTLKRLCSITKDFLNKNPNLIITRADKGNVSVALDRDTYINKIEEMLLDTDTYKIITKDPTKKLTNKLHELHSGWRESDDISNTTYRSLYVSDGILPRAYGLPKIHKLNHPFRIIVSSLNSPLYQFASYLHRIMHKWFSEAQSHILNSFQLVNKLSHTSVKDNFTLISLDAVSLFTNIPVKLTIDSVHRRWDFLANNCSVSYANFISAVRFVLDSTFFTFNGTTYQQTFGTPMGSPLSPIIADIILQDFEKRALISLNFSPSFYVRYVDDIALAAPPSTFEHILSVFNSFHPRLQFTLEIGEDDRLNFLDVTIITD